MAHQDDSNRKYNEALNLIDQAMKKPDADHTFHCLRSTGTERAFFENANDATAFRDKHPEYFGDIVVFCGRCGFFHCSNPGWDVVRPWEKSIKELRMN